MRLDEAHREKERLVRPGLEFLEQADGRGGRRLRAGRAQVALIAATFEPRGGLVDHAHRPGPVTGIVENLPQVPFVGVKVPREIGMAQAHHPVRVRPAAGKDRRPRRTTSGIGAKAPGEPHALARQPVEVRRLNRLHSVAMQILPQVVAVDQQDVGPGRGALEAAGAEGQADAYGQQQSYGRKHGRSPKRGNVADHLEDSGCRRRGQRGRGSGVLHPRGACFPSGRRATIVA